MEWWKRYPIYQIYPRSFKDSNGDGVGDIKGIIEKLNYFEWLGIKVLWISPIYKSPMMDFGYDISDYKDIDPLFGNINDFKDLVHCVHEKDMHLIMDFVPNHTSDQHKWFLASKLNEEPYKDYYIWRQGLVDPKTNERKPPNSVMSVFGGPAWTWSHERQMYYLHHFLPEQPDLNYNNLKVRHEMTQILKYWVDLGVDGFRIDAVTFLGKDETHTDPISTTDANNGATKPPPTVEHAQTFDVDRPQLSGYELIREWVEFLKENYENEGDDQKKHIFICTEGYSDLDSVLRYYDVGVDFPFNFSLVNWTKKSNGQDLRRWINEWMKRMPIKDGKQETILGKRKIDDGKKSGLEGKWPNWVVGNHDQARVATRLGGHKYTNLVNTLLLTLPGTPTCYQGDELGMLDVPVTFDQCQDPYGKRFGPDHYSEYSRDPCRSPMIWQIDQKHGGFTSNPENKIPPWLPLSENKSYFAIDQQKLNRQSHLNFFRQLIKLRNEEEIFYKYGYNLRLLTENDQTYFVYERYAPIDQVKSNYLIILNLDHNSEEKFQNIDLDKEIDYDYSAEIVLASCTDDDRNYREDQEIDLSKIRMKGGEVVIVRLEKLAEKKRKVGNDEK